MAALEFTIGKGKKSIIDAEDKEIVDKYNWRYSQHTKRSDIGYVVTTARLPNGRYSTFSLHRYLLGNPKGKHVDHINGDRLDNRRINLRLSTRSQNAFNVKKNPVNASSRYKGVSWSKIKNKWHARIRKDYKMNHLGYFEDEHLAALAYDKAALKMAGEFALTNFPISIVNLIQTPML